MGDKKLDGLKARIDGALELESDRASDFAATAPKSCLIPLPSAFFRLIYKTTQLFREGTKWQIGGGKGSFSHQQCSRRHVD